MKKISITLALFFPILLVSQSMTNDKLDEIYTSISDSIQGQKGAWQFVIKDVQMMSITDTNHNRMRIISPIASVDQLDDEHFQAALIANFHTALDVKYAVTDGILWSAFIHPLGELTEEQVRDAVSQVYFANVNFGTSYASTSLTFPWRGDGDQPEEPKTDKKTKKVKKI